jgi:hypothetical protein
MFHGGYLVRAEIDFVQEIPGNRRGGEKTEIDVGGVMRNAQSE